MQNTPEGKTYSALETNQQYFTETWWDTPIIAGFTARLLFMQFSMPSFNYKSWFPQYCSTQFVQHEAQPFHFCHNLVTRFCQRLVLKKIVSKALLRPLSSALLEIGAKMGD